MRTAAIAGCASVLASTYHWSVRYGSMTTPERSPCGTMCVFGSILLEEAEILQPRHDLLARGEAVDAVQFLGKLQPRLPASPRR